MKRFAILMLFAAVLVACNSPKVVTMTEYRDRVTHDTIRDTRIDSVYVAHYLREKGDTIYQTDTIIAFKILEKFKTDYMYVHDSVPYAVEVQVPVRTRNGYDRFTSWGFWILLLLLLLRVAWWALRKFYLRQ